MENKTKLLACPFCGSTDLGQADDQCPELDGRDWDNCNHFIVCENCDASGSKIAFKREEDFIAKAKAAWNRRQHHKSEILRWARRAAELARDRAFIEMNDLGKRYVKYPTNIDDVISQLEREMEADDADK